MSVRQIGNDFKAARDAASVAGKKVGLPELKTIVEHAKSGAFTPEEKQKLSDEWHTQVNGTQGGPRLDPPPANPPGATEAAMRYFAKVQQEEHLPVASQVKIPGPMGLVPLTASGNDPGLHVSTTGRSVTLSGIGRNNGFAPSFASLTVEGHTYSVDISRGMTADQLATAFRNKLPDGLMLVIEGQRQAPPNQVTFTVGRSG
ncbi:MAG: hypothetical protein K1X89_15455 [Myxococcaceae bacterium]|nr:hypothetical protein [Myxococcaceae bacterium]